MKHFWLLPVALRLATAANQHAFSVQNDILAYPQYQVIFSDSHLADSHPNDPLSSSHDLSTHKHDTTPATDDPPSYQRMLLNSNPYLCQIPHPKPIPTSNLTSQTPEEAEQELSRATTHGWELLQDMNGTCLFYGAGWWVYSFCYGSGIRQFHPLPPGRGVPIYPPVEDPSVASYSLGTFQSLNNPSELDTNSTTTSLSPRLHSRGAAHYLAQTLSGGTQCDLTSAPRRIEVQFHCNPASADRIHMIKETASCVYLMVVHTARLCNDVAFAPPAIAAPHSIICSALNADKKPPRASDSVDSAASFPSPAPVVIGGIELGAQILVGGHDRSISAGAIVTPAAAAPVETFVATLAESDGKYTRVMGEAEIKRHGLKGKPEDLNKFIDDIESWAGEGQPWKLDVLKTEEGMQFRGVKLGSDEDEDPASTKLDTDEEEEQEEEVEDP